MKINTNCLCQLSLWSDCILSNNLCLLSLWPDCILSNRQSDQSESRQRHNAGDSESCENDKTNLLKREDNKFSEFIENKRKSTIDNLSFSNASEMFVDLPPGPDSYKESSGLKENCQISKLWSGCLLSNSICLFSSNLTTFSEMFLLVENEVLVKFLSCKISLKECSLKLMKITQHITVNQ
jgi:hypothetical protein